MISLLFFNLKIASNEFRIGLKKRHIQVSLVLITLTVIILNRLTSDFLSHNSPIVHWILDFLLIESHETRGILFSIIAAYYFVIGLFGAQFRNLFINADTTSFFGSTSSPREIYASRFVSRMLVHTLYGIVVALCVYPIFIYLGFKPVEIISLLFSLFLYFESNQLISHIIYNIRINQRTQNDPIRKIIMIIIIIICLIIQISYIRYDILSINNMYIMPLLFLSLFIISYYTCNSYIDILLNDSRKIILKNDTDDVNWADKFPISINDMIAILREGGLSLFLGISLGIVLVVYFLYSYTLLIDKLSRDILYVIKYYFPFCIIIIYNSFIPHTDLLKNDILSFWLINLSQISLGQYLRNKYISILIISIPFLINQILILIISNIIDPDTILVLYNTFLIYNFIGFFINSYSIIFLKISNENSFLVNFIQILSSLIFYMINIKLLSISLNYLIILSILLITIIISRYEKPFKYYLIKIMSTVLTVFIILTLSFGLLFFLWIQNWSSNIYQQINPLVKQPLIWFSSIALASLILKIIDYLSLHNLENARRFT